jgi:hypothetical protein
MLICSFAFLSLRCVPSTEQSNDSEINEREPRFIFVFECASRDCVPK